jgi:hypothetical protein
MIAFFTYTSYIFVALFWTLAYIAIIYRGWKDKTYGMPIVAMSANIGWEGLLTFVIPTPLILQIRNVVWFSLDVLILIQCLMYAPRELRHPVLQRYARPIVIASVIMATAVVGTFMVEFQDLRGWYAGFGMNLSMSILFVFMYLDRNDIRGQSLYIALFKFLGTLGAIGAVIFASPENVLTGFTGVLPDQWYPPSPLMLVMYGVIFVFDIIYIVAIYRQIAARGINPWRRF